VVLDDPIDNLWRNRDFGLYFSGVFMATLANQIQSVAVAWQIYAIARSPLALGYVGLAQFLPIAALFFIAADIADRHNRRRILAISYAVQALALSYRMRFSVGTRLRRVPYDTDPHPLQGQTVRMRRGPRSAHMIFTRRDYGLIDHHR